MRGSDPKTNLQRAVLLTALALALVPQSSLAAGDVDLARLRAADFGTAELVHPRARPESDLLLTPERRSTPVM